MIAMIRRKLSAVDDVSEQLIFKLVYNPFKKDIFFPLERRGKKAMKVSQETRGLLRFINLSELKLHSVKSWLGPWV